MEKSVDDQIFDVLVSLFPSIKVESASCAKELEMLDKGFEIGKGPDIFDPVTKPKHYNLNPHGIDCIQAIEASMSPMEFKGYLKGSIEKYIWRYAYKGKALEDLQKAKVYLGWLIERIENDTKA